MGIKRDYILCATDFSESSVHALKWANRMALATGAHLSTLYSYRLIQTGKVADILSFKKKSEEEAKEKYVEIDKALFGGVQNKSFITEIGFFSDNIENFIRKNPSTVVVLSEAIAHSIYDHKGQTLVHFLKWLKVPLLVIPDAYDSDEMPGFLIEKQTVN